VVFLLTAITLISAYPSYYKWQHQTPIIKEKKLMDGLFKLKRIHVNNGFQKELIFTIELTQQISQDNICVVASEMAETLFNKYPFDKTYNKIAHVIFNPAQDNTVSFYKLGDIYQYKNNGGYGIDCYLKYK